MKLISTKVHGILDYVSAAALFVLPRLTGWNGTTKRLLTGSAVGTVAYSLFTDYELGVLKILPMKGHLALDSVQSLLLGTAPFLFRSIRKKSTAAGLLGLSLYETLVILNSESDRR